MCTCSVARVSTAAMCLGIVLLPCAFGGAEIGEPVVYNNYSYISPVLPNYGIAQGSIFTMTPLGPPYFVTVTASQGVPLQSSLAGVTVTVTVGSVITQAIPYYVSPTQVTAILPSKTPVGHGTVTVTSSRGSASAPISVVPAAFGLATVSTPPGPVESWPVAVAQDANEGGQLLSQADAANPGEYLTLWGSGLGPVPGDETQYQTPADLTDVPIEVDIGGVSATVTYHGRSTYPGLDQIDVIVPPGVSGCNASVVVTAGGMPSNYGTIPVAASGRICTDPGLVPLTASEYQSLLGLGNVNLGAISLTAFMAPGTSTFADSTSATFGKYPAAQVVASDFLQVPSIGSCVLTSDGAPPLLSASSAGFNGALNAGTQVNVRGPGGLLVLLPGWAGSDTFTGTYGPEAWGTPPQIVSSTGGGPFTFDNGSGGPDVGAFQSSASASATTPFVWTNSSAITAVDRAQAPSITWTGGIPGSYVSIFGDGPWVSFICSAPLSAGQFTLPPAVVESMPSTAATELNINLYVVDETIQIFSAPGLDLGLFFFGSGSGISVPVH